MLYILGYTLYLFLKGKKKSSIMTSAVINEGTSAPSAFRTISLGKFKSQIDFKKNQRAHQFGTRQTPPVQMAERLQSSNQNPAWSKSIILSVHCGW